MKHRILSSSVIVVAALVQAAPAFAGTITTPAPIAGIGIGAVALIGAGYRALKRRSER